MQNKPYLNVFQQKSIVPKLWGYEKIIVNENKYCGKILTLLPNKMASSLHFHKQKIETFHVLSGFVKFEIWGRRSSSAHQPSTLYSDLDITNYYLIERATLIAGMSLTLRPEQPHRFWVIDEIAQFIEFSTPDDPADSYRIVPSGPAPIILSLSDN